MREGVEVEYRGKKIVASYRAAGATEWQLTVDGVTRGGFPGSENDPPESVFERLIGWARSHPELFERRQAPRT
jgi:hypothetical protein